MYLDSAYIAKIYLNESDSSRVRTLLKDADSVVSSLWAVCEVTCVFHRQWREGWLTAPQHQELAAAFLKHANAGIWTLIPVTERILKRAVSLVNSLPAGTYIRAGDAIHLTTYPAYLCRVHCGGAMSHSGPRTTILHSEGGHCKRFL